MADSSSGVPAMTISHTDHMQNKYINWTTKRMDC